MKPRSILVVFLLAMAGCTTAAQRQYQAMAVNSQQAFQGIQACMTAVRNAADYSPIRDHIPFNLNDATLQQLSDETLATDEQAATIITVHPRTQACRKQMLDTLLQANPTSVPILTATYAAQDDALVLLIEKKITWAELLRRARAASSRASSEILAQNQRITADLNQQHQAEVAQRQAAGYALMQWSQNQQMINALNRPTITNCSAFANMASCVTR